MFVNARNLSDQSNRVTIALVLIHKLLGFQFEVINSWPTIVFISFDFHRRFSANFIFDFWKSWTPFLCTIFSLSSCFFHSSAELCVRGLASLFLSAFSKPLFRPKSAFVTHLFSLSAIYTVFAPELFVWVPSTNLVWNFAKPGACVATIVLSRVFLNSFLSNKLHSTVLCLPSYLLTYTNTRTPCD